MISVIVPIYNEKENVKNLLKKLKNALGQTHQEFELIFVDDHSTDGTWKELQNNRLAYKLRVFRKQGQKGKAFSLIEGFEKARGNTLVMIDSDLQYPPSAIPQMVKALKNVDIVVANRKTYNDSPVRKVLSRGFKFTFGKLLFNLNCDIQSGLKAFKREAYEEIKFSPKSQWTFDLEFLHRANHAGLKIANVNIDFNPREKGKSSIGILKTGWEIGLNALILKTKKINPVQIKPTNDYSMKGAGVAYKKQRFITHSTLAHNKSALNTLNSWQKIFLISIIAALAIGLFLSVKSTILAFVGLITVIYFTDVLFNAFLIFKSLKSQQEIYFSDEQIKRVNDNNLPIYTILCPLYKEADILPHFAASIESLDWPKDKLEVLLLLEEDDVVTQKVAKNLFLPSYFKVIVVPTSNPKTKPKACNYGLHFATGKYLVIYDAEDRPDPLQLKKAHLAFEKYGDKIGCFQAKLNYYNTHHNLLTRFFTAEYSLWFGLTLTGLQSIGTAIPLGGTSNHFRTKDIHKFEGWDPFNVTEDADLGVRLFKAGYKTAILDSTTFEEANSKVGNWMRQRSRWIKGYMQTYLVHNRDIPTFIKEQKIHSLIFQLIVGGKIAFVMINPFMWVTTIIYFALRPIVGPSIEQFFQGPIFYMAAFCLVAGNFLYLYYYMIAAVKQGKFNLVKFIFLIPVYWLMISTAFWIAAYQLIFKPHYWEKTVHGLHLDYEKRQAERAEAQLKEEKVRWQKIKSIRDLVRSGTAEGGILIAATIASNFLNFVYNAYLTRSIAVENFGLVTLVGSFVYLASIPLNSLSRAVTQKTAFYFGKYNATTKIFWAHTRKRAIFLALGATALWILLTPLLEVYFKTPSWIPFLVFAPVFVISTAGVIDDGFLSGNLKFKLVSVLLISQAVSKLLLTWALVNLNLQEFVYAAIPASLGISFIIGWFFASSTKEQGARVEPKKLVQFPYKFFIASNFREVSAVAFLSLDLILAKHYLSPVEAGNYAILSLAGKMIFLVSILLNQFILPIVSHQEGAKKNSQKAFYKIFLVSIFLSTSAYLLIGLFGPITAPILFGPKVDPIVNLLPIYGLGILAFTIATGILTFYQARSKNIFVAASVILTGAQLITLSIFHQNINAIVLAITISGLVNLAAMVALHFTHESLTIVLSNVRDLLGVLGRLPFKAKSEKEKLNILIFNWRDTKHTWAGGAEVYIHEIAKRLVEQGNQVTVFCGNDEHCSRNEVIDGVQMVRRGGFYTVYVWAFLYYVIRFRGKYDLIIDSENGIPFFTPLYTRTPVICLVHHVHQDVFRGNLIWPLAVLGKFLEGKVMPIVYRNVQMVTVSQSSKEALEKLGFGKRKQIEIIHPGVDLSALKPGNKTKNPSILYLGRLKPYKSIETAVKIMPAILKKFPKAKFTIAGKGESKEALLDLVKELGVESTVEFLGKVSEKTKSLLLSRSWVMVQPSMIEGWGITAIEANASGTPVIASDVPGLRDSVRNPHSGLLVTWDNEEKWTKALTDVLGNRKLREDLSTYAQTWSKNFSWDSSSRRFTTIIKNAKYEKNK